jgi:uncharacterized membrane protein YphA (DoxX/SURF4 family)
MPYLALIARLVIALVFIVSGWAKLQNPGEFRRTVAKFDLLPDQVARGFAAGLPWLEVALGLGMAAGLQVDILVTIVTLLVAVFTGAVILSMARGKNIECGCFGRLVSSKVGWHLIIRNCVLIGLLGLVFSQNGGAAALAP